MNKFMRKCGAVAVVAASAVLGMSGAFAAVPASVATAFTAVGTDAASVADLAVPIVLSVLGLTLVIKLIKRFGNKI